MGTRSSPSRHLFCQISCSSAIVAWRRLRCLQYCCCRLSRRRQHQRPQQSYMYKYQYMHTQPASHAATQTQEAGTSRPAGDDREGVFGSQHPVGMRQVQRRGTEEDQAAAWNREQSDGGIRCNNSNNRCGCSRDAVHHLLALPTMSAHLQQWKVSVQANGAVRCDDCRRGSK